MSEATGQASTPEKRCFLIVDDDDDAHFILKRHLKRLGVDTQVDSVRGGEDAIKYFESCMAGTTRFPALVFLDVKMPGMDGFDVLEWLRNKGLLGQLTLSMLSSSDHPKDVSRAMSLGAHTYLTKPPDSEHLLKIVASATRLAGN